MDLLTVAVGIIQLIIAVIFAVLALYIGFSVFGTITKDVDEQKELAKGNVAFGIIVAGLLVILVAIIQLVLGVLLAIASIYLALNILDKFTKELKEFEELKKGNVAVALEFAGVIIAVALIIQSGVAGITAAIA